MKTLLYTSSTLMGIFLSSFFAQAQTTTNLYAHKVVLDSIIQTTAYTYLKVHEKIRERDSVQWIALPRAEAKAGNTYYYNNGLQMGEFQSKELNRTFNQILFLGTLGTTPEISEKDIIPVPIIDTLPHNYTPPIIHTVIVKEVLQAGGYTYLRAKEGNKEEWLAVVRKPAEVGQTYTYDDAAPMKNFTSNELKRTFDEVLFVAKLTLATNQPSMTDNSSGKTKRTPKSISIAKLMENKKSYSGKIVKVEGKVTKYSADIMNKNWLHIEDGTAYSGKYDITLTTDQTVKVGDQIIVIGKISLDKDFGSGYFFDVIMEDATIQNK